MRTKEEISAHKKSVHVLENIFDNVEMLIANNPNITEYDMQKDIESDFKKYNHSTDKDHPIVAYRENSSVVHYYPQKKGSKKLKKGSVVLVDIRARQKNEHSPFADITQMFYYGDILPKNIEKVFNDVIFIRDKTIEFIEDKLQKKSIPTGAEIQNITSEQVNKLGYKGKMNHYVGHCIGFYSPHGNRKNITPTNNSPLEVNLGYTIEPGIYLKDNFGIRSEINFYIDEKLKLEVTTKKQKQIRIIKPR